MSQIIKKFIAADAVDSAKLKLANNTAVRSRNAANSADVNVIKLNASDEVEVGAALNMGTFAITNVGNVDGRDVSADGTALDAHLNGGASKHDATEVDYERADGSKKDIQAASDDVETALTDLDDNKISKAGTIAFTGDQAMGGFKLTGLGAGSAAGHSVRYEQVILRDGSQAFTAAQSLGGFKLTSVADPTLAQDAATKAYVDASLEGLKPKQAVRASSTANVVIASALENGDSLDGITLATGDRVLLKDQTDPIENGIYIVAASGAAARSADANASSEFLGAYVLVSHGTANAGRGYVCTVGSSFALATDPVTFVQFSSSGSLVGGDMITVSGATISVDLHATSGLESSNAGNDAGELRVKLEASNPTLQIDGSNQLGAKFSATTSGLEATASGLAINVEASNPTLEVNGSGEAKVKFDTAQGLAQGANGLEIDLSATGGLEFASGDIAINVDATNGTSKVNASNELEVIKKEEQQITLAGGDITNQYIDLSFTARAAASISLSVEGGPQQERTVDYTVSLAGGAGGVTRISFAGDLATAGAAELIAGDKVFVSYEYL